MAIMIYAQQTLCPLCITIHLLPRQWYCCNLSAGVVLNVWFTMNRMCTKN